ncbi:MAG TPA: hypothetical protein VMW51_09745 [Terriglobia bacterium]|nr:hypothetical protein [Terriglobia bacterium]
MTNFHRLILYGAAAWLLLYIAATRDAASDYHPSAMSARQRAARGVKGGVWASGGSIGQDASDDLPYATGNVG